MFFRLSKIYKIFYCVFILSNYAHAQELIRLNQMGFYPEGPKFAIAVGTTSDVFYLTSVGMTDTLFTGTMGAARVWPHSNESVKLIDFKEFQQPGAYKLVVDDIGQSYTFLITNRVHNQLAIGAMKAYYYQRMSTPLLEEFAGEWHRPAGHLDNEVFVHASAASDSRPENTVISAPEGWYDAGDYNKYIVNSGISTYTILAAYEHFTEYYKELNLNIPESNNDIPDILDEALWNLRWMLKMQDPNDGGVYHKLTTANFSGAVMPHVANAQRYVVKKSTPATLDFAAVMAQASRIFSNFEQELPGLADSCLNAALDAWRWARQNSNVRYSQSEINSQFDPDINTGEYGDGGNFSDEFQWASAELFITTKTDSFLTVSDPLSGSLGIPWWQSVNTLGLYSIVFHRQDIGDMIDTTRAVNFLINLANDLKGEISNSAYHVMMGKFNWDFVWGSNAVAGNQGMALIQAYNLTRDETYLEAALQNLDYLLGRNAVGFSFVTGFGTKPTLNPHHRQSQADNVSDPVPGLLAGGPNPGRQDGCSGYIGAERATSYVDDWCSYASNEIAINWNAPLVYLSGSIEAAYSPPNKPTSVLNHEHDRNLPEQFGLGKNYPNPFNASTNIVFFLSSQSSVNLEIYNTTGKLIRTLERGEISKGTWTVNWDGRSDAGVTVSSGVYIVKLTANQLDGKTLSDSIKVTLLK